MKKWFLVAIVVIAAGLSFWPTTEKSTAKQAISISGPFEFHSRELSTNGYVFSRLQIVESLVAVDEKANPEPLLAKSWMQSKDGLTWSFMLRRKVTFHNGTELTPHIVVNDLKRAQQHSGVLQQVPITNITHDDEQVIIRLSRPYRPLLFVLAHYSTAILAPESFDDNGNITQIIGTGPYEITNLQMPNIVKATAYTNYWGKPANIPQLNYLSGHRPESRALLAQNGQADIAYSIDPASMEALKNSKNLHMKVAAMPRTVMLKLNNAHPYLNNVKVRHALSLAIDRHEIANKELGLPGSEAYQLFSPALGAWHIDGLENRHRNLAEARKLLANAGWQLNSQGVLQRDGKTFTLNLVTYADRPELPLIATAIQNQLKQVGVVLKVQIIDAQVIPEKQNDGTLDMALIARNYGMLSDPLPILLNDFAEHTNSAWGPMNWSSPKLLALLNTLTSETDKFQYQRNAQLAAHLLVNEMPLIPITYYHQIIAVNKRLQHFRFDPFELNYRVAELTLKSH